MLLQNERIRLRAMEPDDCELMYRWENDSTLWSLGEVTRPFSRDVLNDFIRDASLDLYQARQLRLIIELRKTAAAIGCIDLFSFDPINKRAGVGILIYDTVHRCHGYGTDALELLTGYAFRHLELRQLWADIPVSNTASLNLFKHVGFTGQAVRRQWIRRPDNTYEDVRFLQRFP